MSTTAAPVILPSYKATNGVSNTTQYVASPISAATSTSSQTSWVSGISTTGYASSCTSVSQESVYEKSEERKYEQTVYGSGGLASAEAEFAKLMSEIPWMRFQITATPDAAWLQEERFKAVFHALTQKTVKATTARVISKVKVEMNKVLDVLAASEEHIDMATVIQDIQKAFVLGACGAVTSGQTLVAGHLPCGCHHKGGAQDPCIGTPVTPRPEPREGPVTPLHPAVPGPPPLVPAPQIDILAKSKAPTPNLTAAQWIWTKEADGIFYTSKYPPAGARSFRKRLMLDGVVDSVTIDITADDYDTLYVNGALVGSGINWENPRRYTVRFNPTKVVVVCVWAMQKDGEAALAVAGVAWNSQKKEPVPRGAFWSDSSWKTQSHATPEKVFLDALRPEFNDERWEKVYTHGAFGQTKPWKGHVKPSKESNWSEGLTNIEGSVDAPKADRAILL